MARMGGKRRALGRNRRNRFNRRVKPVAKLSKPIVRAVKRIVRGEAETKRTNWYQTFNDGTVTTPATGFFGTAGFAVQNDRIVSNNTDILRLIPQVLQGVDDYNRIGQKIRPVNLSLKGQIRVRLSLLNTVMSTLPQSLTIDVYVLQHQILKNYSQLYANNDFDQLLETGEGNTVAYSGLPHNSAMRVANQYYQVLQRRRVTLRYAGTVNGAAATQTPFAQPQDHVWLAEYSMNLTKHLPRVLHYPEGGTSANPTPPLVLNAPTNSSIFMCMGYLSWYVNSENSQIQQTSIIEQTYMTELAFKDM